MYQCSLWIHPWIKSYGFKLKAHFSLYVFRVDLFITFVVGNTMYFLLFLFILPALNSSGTVHLLSQGAKQICAKLLTIAHCARSYTVSTTGHIWYFPLVVLLVDSTARFRFLLLSLGDDTSFPAPSWKLHAWK